METLASHRGAHFLTLEGDSALSALQFYLLASNYPTFFSLVAFFTFFDSSLGEESWVFSVPSLRLKKMPYSSLSISFLGSPGLTQDFQC